MSNIILIGLGGFIGAILRFSVGQLAQNNLRLGGIPVGTFLVNVIGCFLLGAAIVVANQHENLALYLRPLFMVGLLGAFTTFSTFGVETITLFLQGNLRGGIFNVAANNILGLAAAWIGYSLTNYYYLYND